MNLSVILSDSSLKGIKHRQAVIDCLLADNSFLLEVECLLPQLKERDIAVILEAIEEVSNKKMKILGEDYLRFAERFINSESNTCKREASRIVGNLCASFPKSLEESIALLMTNTKDEGTVVRWSAAYALSRIILIPDYAMSDLYDTILSLEAEEMESGVKSQYTKALKKAAKLRATTKR